MSGCSFILALPKETSVNKQRAHIRPVSEIWDKVHPLLFFPCSTFQKACSSGNQPPVTSQRRDISHR